MMNKPYFNPDNPPSFPVGVWDRFLWQQIIDRGCELMSLEKRSVCSLAMKDRIAQHARAPSL
jgi:hypothetical protein